MSTLQSKFLTIEQEMNQAHFERADVARSLLVALIAGQHVIKYMDGRRTVFVKVPALYHWLKANHRRRPFGAGS